MNADTVFAALGAGASLVALIAFLVWLLDQRRRPEVRFLWRLGPGDDETGVVDWPADKPAVVRARSSVVVEASILNVGDAATRRALSNLVVPGCIKLASLASEPQRARRSHNGIAGLEPDWGVYFVAASFELPPGTWFMQRFSLALPDVDDLTVRVLFELSDDRLNASGRRWLWSRLVAGDPPAAPVGTPWPPEPRPGHRWARVRAEPAGRLLCRRGTRADVRELRIMRVKPE